jgi:hypothetical protein
MCGDSFEEIDYFALLLEEAAVVVINVCERYFAPHAITFKRLPRRRRKQYLHARRQRDHLGRPSLSAATAAVGVAAHVIRIRAPAANSISIAPQVPEDAVNDCRSGAETATKPRRSKASQQWSAAVAAPPPGTNAQRKA